jgi:hypothetical protein
MVGARGKAVGELGLGSKEGREREWVASEQPVRVELWRRWAGEGGGSSL